MEICIFKTKIPFEDLLKQYLPPKVDDENEENGTEDDD